MKASEILHGIAELLAGLETNNGTTQAAEVPVSKFTPNTQEPVSAQHGAIFVPPLQAKIELLKKNNLRLVQRSFDDFENRTI